MGVSYSAYFVSENLARNEQGEVIDVQVTYSNFSISNTNYSLYANLYASSPIFIEKNAEDTRWNTTDYAYRETYYHEYGVESRFTDYVEGYLTDYSNNTITVEGERRLNASRIGIDPTITADYSTGVFPLSISPYGVLVYDHGSSSYISTEEVGERVVRAHLDNQGRVGLIVAYDSTYQ